MRKNKLSKFQINIKRQAKKMKGWRREEREKEKEGNRMTVKANEGVI